MYFNLLPTFCKDWTLAFIPRQHSFRNFKLNLEQARLVFVVVVGCTFFVLKSLSTSHQKNTLTTWPISLNNFVKRLTSHHWLQSPLKVKMINIHSPQGLTLMFPVHFKGDGSNDRNNSQVYYNRQRFNMA